MGSPFAQAESSSSSPNFKWSYDVFLSFRGVDTRSNFTSHLHMALRQKGLNFFIDDKLNRGGQISESLLKSIEGSRISIIIFSENYASSTWCLDELVKIIECMKSKGQIVLPVFYKVDPSEVRKQTGRFGEALAKHEAKFMTNIQIWKEALTTAGGLSGWDLATRKEADLIQDLVKEVLSKVNRTQLLHVAKHPVGIYSQLRNMEDLVSHVVSDGVYMLGICGMGGIGKTTLAKALYNKIANQFEGRSFLSNVREASEQYNGLVQLQHKLLYEILESGRHDLEVGNIDKGINLIRDRLCSKKVLIILDDVDKLEQLDALIGGHDWFGGGSRIIVTTRNKHLLDTHSFDKIYTIPKLDPNKSLELFSRHAFKESHPSSNYLDLSERATSYCKGLPLALVILGSLLHKSEQIIWKSKLDELENSLEPDIEDVLQISFKGLQDKVKEIFLHISCFFVGEDVNCIRNILDACDLYPDCGIKTLHDRSLLAVENGKIQMHDLIRQMGQTIVCRESSEPEKRSRLWVAEEVFNMLNENSGTDAVKAIKLEGDYKSRLLINAEAFRNMKNLRLLILRRVEFSTNIFEYLPNKLKWFDCSDNRFPENLYSFPPSLPTTIFVKDQLFGLQLQRSSIKYLGNRFENCKRLKHVDISYCSFLEEIPDFSAALNLQKLYLRRCESLKMLHESVAFLSKLTTLDLEDCFKLEKLPSYLMLKSLEVLNLRRCIRLEEIPDLSASSNLKELNLRGCRNLRIIHRSDGRSLDKLITLDLEQCSNLERLPPSYVMSESLQVLDLADCAIMAKKISDFSFEKFPSHLKLKSLQVLKLCYCKNLEEITDFSIGSNLWILDLSSCFNLRMIHESIGSLDKLVFLDLGFCSNLEKLPSYLRLKSLTYLSLFECKKLEKLPEFDANMKSLREMELDRTAIKELPPSIGYLIRLEKLSLKGCANLITLPSEIHLLKNLKELRLHECSKFDMFPQRSSLNFPQEISLCSKLTTLDLANCNISNANFLETLSNVCPSSLFELNLSGNKFSCLPSLHNFKSLRVLELRNCKFLRNIANLPHCLQRVDFGGCELLVLSHDFIADIIFRKQDHGFNGSRAILVMNSTAIPNYFNNQTTESSIGFSIQRRNPNKGQALVVCVVFKVDGDDSYEAKASIQYTVLIDEFHKANFRQCCHSSKSEYMWLMKIPLAFWSSDVNDWHNIEAKFRVARVCVKVDDEDYVKSGCGDCYLSWKAMVFVRSHGFLLLHGG